jgi:hypothetical protein
MITDSEIRALMQVCSADATPIDARGAQLSTERYSRMVRKTDTSPNRTFQPTPLRVRKFGAF